MDRWLRSIRKEGTKRLYRDALITFSKHVQKSPADLLKHSEEELEDMLQDWKVSMLERGLAGSTVKVRVVAAVQFLKFNRKRIRSMIRDVKATRTYLDYIPTRTDVQALLDAAKLHHKIIVALMAFSGLRPVDVSQLQYMHVKRDLERGEEVLTITKRHQKTDEWYFTFLAPQGTRYLRTWLDARREKGEKITSESYIVTRWDDRPLKISSVRHAVHRLIRLTVGPNPSGEPFRAFRPYGLRKYFRRAIDKIGGAEAEFLMGHQSGLVSLEATYSGLRDMDPQAIATLKKKYISVLPELETEVTDITLKAQLEEKEKRLKTFEESIDEVKRDQKRLEEFLKKLAEREKREG